mmetsp:Transcript_1891/g.5009  ORF Transcript_1891/g.5009 Transcript_1891/m.5009 type:complete len:80 (+) Transcript_1891:191-430(+)
MVCTNRIDSERDQSSARIAQVAESPQHITISRQELQRFANPWRLNHTVTSSQLNFKHSIPSLPESALNLRHKRMVVMFV